MEQGPCRSAELSLVGGVAVLWCQLFTVAVCPFGDGAEQSLPDGQGYMFTLFISWWLLGEELNVYKVVGVIVISLGAC